MSEEVEPLERVALGEQAVGVECEPDHVGARHLVHERLVEWLAARRHSIARRRLHTEPVAERELTRDVVVEQ